MQSRLFKLGTAMLLLLCVVAAAAWIASYWRAASCGYYAALDGTGLYRDYYFYSTRGAISYTWFAQSAPSTTVRGTVQCSLSQLQPARMPWLWVWRNDEWALIGFSYERYGSPAFGWHTIGIPYWCLMLVCGMPAIWRLTRPPITPGHCSVCGYDLRATPDRCPECGTEVRNAAKLS